MSSRLAIGAPLLSAHWRMLLWDRLVGGLRVGVMFPLVVFWAGRHGVEAAAMGWLYAASGAGGVLGSMLCTRFIRRWGKKHIALLASLIACSGWVVMGLAENFPAMLLAQFLAGIGLSVSFIINDAYIGAHSTAEKRAKLFSVALAFRGAGIFFGALLFSWLANVFWVSGAVCLLLLLTMGLAQRYLPISEAAADMNAMAAQILINRAVSGKVIRAAAAGLTAWFLFFLGESFIGRYVPIHAQDYLQAPPEVMAALFASMGLTMVIAPLTIRWATQLLPEWCAAALGLLCVAALALLCAVTQEAYLLLMAFIVWGLLWDTVCPFLTAFISRSVSVAEQTQVMALAATVVAVVSMLGPVIAGYLYGAIGSTALFSIAALISTAAAGICWHARHNFSAHHS